MPKKSAVGEGKIHLVLAHPLPAERARELDLGDEVLEVGQEIRLDDKARALQFINGGLVQVDPEDRAAVRAAIGSDVQRPANSTAG